MKKFIFIITPILIFLTVAITTLLSQNKHQGLNENIDKLNKKKIALDKKDDPLTDKISCKTCHVTEYPTRKDPGLRSCPRDKMVSGFPSSKTGPDIVVIDDMSENYSGVRFSHGLHSQMSEMSLGCVDCHHYNISTEEILKCSDCHNRSRSREEVSVPDLKSAFHRQCMMCHKQWSHENGCNNQCHVRKGQENNLVLKDFTGKVHPKLTEPTKMIWETNYEKGKIVTFFHNEHIQLFKINCKSCHGNDRCEKCHEKQQQPTDYSKPIHKKKSFDEHHMPCVNCHKSENCQKCHRDQEMIPFNHGKSTGWVLKSYHSQLSCEKCHGGQMPVKKVDRNCSSCHKNFVQGKFDHNKTGLVLSGSHKDMECISCHLNNDFSKNPDCKTCHDDKTFPANLPGKRK